MSMHLAGIRPYYDKKEGSQGEWLPGPVDAEAEKRRWGRADWSSALRERP